jgi:hypothetical protein
MIRIPPVELPPLRETEVDGRYLDCTKDLAPTGDTFPSITVLSLAIMRHDGVAMTSTDLQPAGTQFPAWLDATGLIPTFGLAAPIGCGGVTYILTLTANLTTQNRLWVRDWVMTPATLLG